MTEYIKGFSFIIEKAKVFIEASALDERGGHNSVLLSIEAPCLRAVATCYDYGYTVGQFKRMGNHSPSDADFRERRASEAYECRLLSLDTRQWEEALVRPQYEVGARSATSSDTVFLVDAASDKPSFQSVPLTENLILELCHLTYQPKKDVIYVAEKLWAKLDHPDDWEKAFDEILKIRAGGQGDRK